MAKQINAEKLLSKALSLVNKDIKHIEKLGNAQKLDPASAQDLVRYANLLDDIIKRKKSEEGDLKKKLSKLSTDELLEKYQQLRTAKPTDGKA